MPYGTVNADVIQTSTSGGILGAGNASIMKNRIINGAMVIDQRNAGASVSSGFSVDRFGLQFSSASKFTAQQNAGSVTPPTGFSYYLGCTSSAATSLGASDYYGIYQNIEGFNFSDCQFGTASAKTINLSFQVYSSLTGTFGGALRNSANNRSYPFTYTISSANTWTTASITIAGDTSGTWVGATTGIGIAVLFSLGTGSTLSGTAGAWGSANYLSATGATSVVGTSGATFYITGVQLEVGSSATGFEYVNYQTSLANCQRYFIKYGPNTYANGFANQSTNTISLFYLQVPMRAVPTLGTTGTASNYAIRTYDAAGPYLTCNSVPILSDYSSSYNFTQMRVGANVASGLTAGNAIMLYDNSGTSYISFSAEL
jgi:hypothetical protein